MNTEWIIALIAIVLIGTAAACAIVVIQSRYENQESQSASAQGKWFVEFWNIQAGFKVCLDISNSLVLGRYNLYSNACHSQPLNMDSTISREHLLLYDQNSALWAWNLSVVNPATINGHRLNAPQQLAPGNRVQLGNSVFLVTRVEQR